MKSNSYSKEFRLRNKSDFLNLKKGSFVFRGDLFLFIYKKNNLPYSRISFALKRNFSNAVKRNRVKRIFRELFRQDELIKYYGIDILIVSKNKIPNNFEMVRFKDFKSFNKSLVSF